MEANFELIPLVALNWHKGGKKVALATVIDTWNSAPRPVGSQLVVSAEKNFMGSVSGGCVEGAVIESALSSIENESCQLLEFGVSNETAFSVGLPCGGSIKIMIEPIGVGNGLPITFLEELKSAVHSGQLCSIVTDINSYRRVFLKNGKQVLGEFTRNMPVKGSEIWRQALPVLESNFFFNIYRGTLKLVIIGAVHIAQFLAEIAKISGYQIIIIDPREAFCSAEKFPGSILVNDWPEDALQKVTIDSSTAIAILAHDPKLDDSTLSYVLNSKSFYIGCLGSKKNHAKRVDRLKLKGFTEAQISRIHAPIGLNIGARSPAEIALAIMSEVTMKLRALE